jgi:hypothetical protein
VDVARATEVAERLTALSASMENGFLEVCDLLLEAHEGQYHSVYGYGRFTDWVVEGSGLDCGARMAGYFVQIAKKARQLGLTREDLAKIRISKLKMIFSLDPLEHGEEMRQYLVAAQTEPLSSIEDKVRALRKQAGKPNYVTMKISIEPEAKVVVDDAFELARMQHGSVVREGEIADISDGRCLEMISASFLNDPNNHEEREFGGGAIDVEYEEVEE